VARFIKLEPGAGEPQAREAISVRVVQISGGGHGIVWNEPREAVKSAILDFLASL
jgi:hypothetical protein